MGNVAYWYKKTLQSFAQAITDDEDEQIPESTLESEELLESFIRERRKNINIKEFYFNAGVVTDQIVSETATMGNDSINAAMFALCSFMVFIDLVDEDEEEEQLGTS